VDGTYDVDIQHLNRKWY